MNPRRRPAGNRTGFALLLTLLGILVLEVIAAGSFHVATQQVRTARAATRALQLQLAAQSGAALALRDWDGAGADSLALDSTRILAFEAPASGISHRVALGRVDEAFYVLRSEAFGTSGETASLMLLVRTAGPADYLADLPAAAAVAAGVSGGGTLDGDATVACGDSIGRASIPALALADSSIAANLDPDVLAGTVEVVPLADPIFQLAGVDLVTIAAPLEVSTLTPGPAVALGACLVSVPGNLGAPGDPTHPCADHHPILHAPGDLVLDGGAGQGVLLVDGNARLEAGAVHHGLLIVRGTLSVAGGSAVLGAVRVGGSLALADGMVRFEPCHIARAVAHGRGMRGPFRAEPHWWIPM